MSELVTVKTEVASREDQRVAFMRDYKARGRGWEDALVAMRRKDLMSRNPAHHSGQTQYVRWYWGFGRATK